jgi:NADH-quinone oxidoreductase subunit J
VCVLVIWVGALATVLSQNPIRGAVGLLATIVGIAGLFLRLNAQFLAAIQLIVYAGAVVVLFVFVIMLLGPAASSTTATPASARLSRWLGAVALSLLAIAALLLVGGQAGDQTPLRATRPAYGSIESVGGMIFTQGIVPFELATALLIVAVVGAIAVARTRGKRKSKKQTASPTERLFHGPLHPRDAGQPLPKEPV